MPEGETSTTTPSTTTPTTVTPTTPTCLPISPKSEAAPTTTTPATTTESESFSGFAPKNLTRPMRQDPIPNAIPRLWCDDTPEDVRGERHYACSQSNTQFDAEVNADLNFDGEKDVIGTAFAKVEIGIRTTAKDPTVTGIGSLRVQYLYASGIFANRNFSFKILNNAAKPATFDTKFYKDVNRTNEYTPDTYISLAPNGEQMFVIDQKFKNINNGTAAVSSALALDLQGMFDTPNILVTYKTTTETFVYPQVRCDGGYGDTGIKNIGCVLPAGRAILEMNARRSIEASASRSRSLGAELWSSRPTQQWIRSPPNLRYEPANRTEHTKGLPIEHN
ncbi:hypothetical protein ACFWNH_29145 [Rhodococcus qingshengii]|uniref:hypothetical protein n=1 Tax=Rhodococcus qingshengii TaxID=334542 RepID=UPI0036513297